MGARVPFERDPGRAHKGRVPGLRYRFVTNALMPQIEAEAVFTLTPGFKYFFSSTSSKFHFNRSGGPGAYFVMAVFTGFLLPSWPPFVFPESAPCAYTGFLRPRTRA